VLTRILRSNSLLMITAIGCGSLMTAFSAPPSLSSASSPAVAWSPGVLRINGADHSGSGNILPGAQLDTLRSASNLYLADGSRLRLAASTRLSVQPQAVQLHGGSARIDSISSQNHPLNVSVGELYISAIGGTIQRPTPNEIIVTADAATTTVRRANGFLLALVRPGQTLSFAVQDAGKPNTTDSAMTGCVVSHNGHFFLTDETTSIKAELQGLSANQYQGKRVQARGELIQDSAPDRSRLIVKQYTSPQAGTESQSCDSKGAAAAATGTTPNVVKATAAGLSKTTITGIVVAAGAGLGTSIGFIAADTESTISK